MFQTISSNPSSTSFSFSAMSPLPGVTSPIPMENPRLPTSKTRATFSDMRMPKSWPGKRTQEVGAQPGKSRHAVCCNLQQQGMYKYHYIHCITFLRLGGERIYLFCRWKLNIGLENILVHQHTHLLPVVSEEDVEDVGLWTWSKRGLVQTTTQMLAVVDDNNCKKMVVRDGNYTRDGRRWGFI